MIDHHACRKLRKPHQTVDILRNTSGWDLWDFGNLMFPVTKMYFPSGYCSTILQSISGKLHAHFRGRGQGQGFWTTFIFHMRPGRRQTDDGRWKGTHMGQTLGPEKRKQGRRTGMETGPLCWGHSGRESWALPGYGMRVTHSRKPALCFCSLWGPNWIDLQTDGVGFTQHEKEPLTEALGCWEDGKGPPCPQVC